MAKANKTVETKSSVKEFINGVEDEQKRKDCFALVKMMRAVSGSEAKMWGPAIVGFGSYHYKYESGREGDAPLIAFSPRKAAISLYIYTNIEKNQALLEKLGKFKIAKACISIKKLSDINEPAFNQIAKNTMEHYKKKYPGK